MRFFQLVSRHLFRKYTTCWILREKAAVKIALQIVRGGNSYMQKLQTARREFREIGFMQYDVTKYCNLLLSFANV